MDLSLLNKKALICGSSQGIGLAVAQELALLGAHCTLVARNKGALETAVASLDTSLQQQHSYHMADFSLNEQTEALASKLASEAAFHVLINNSGGPAAGPIIKASPRQFTDAFQQHLITNQIITLSVIEGMKAAGYGRIINIISTSVKVPLKNLGVSNTIRGAVASWAKTMANELGQFGITVNNVLPGLTATKRLESLLQSTAAASGQSIEAVEKSLQEEVPAKRFGHAAEVAAMVAFLASPAAAYVNGTSIPVDGGRTGSL